MNYKYNSNNNVCLHKWMLPYRYVWAILVFIMLFGCCIQLDRIEIKLDNHIKTEIRNN